MVGNCEPYPYGEWHEIGYPAKLKEKLLKDEGWEIEKVIRGGKLEENFLLTDDVVISELTGSTGTNRVSYNKVVDNFDLSIANKILSDVGKCLIDNEIWLCGIRKAIQEVILLLEKNNFSLSGEVKIFNPSNTLLSIYYTLTDPNQQSQLPIYEFSLEGSEVSRFYYGCLVYTGKKSHFKEIIEEFYDNNSSNLLFSRTWGGYQENDIDISHAYGLEYSNYKAEMKNGQKKFYKFDGFRYKECEGIHPDWELEKLINENPKFIEDVVEFFESHSIVPGLFSF